MVEAQAGGANGEMLDLDVPQPIPDISAVLNEFAAFRDALTEDDAPVEFGATAEIVEVLAVNRRITNQHPLR
jgi:antitoxin component HigA of HigAB toxin-antitoxin module